MKSLSFAAAALMLCSVALVADVPDSLPLPSPELKPAPLIVLVEAPDAAGPAALTDKTGSAAPVESTVEAPPEPNIAPVPPAPEAETNTAALAAKRSGGTINKIWVASVAAVLGGTTMDAASSWGKAETNPILRSANGTFGMRGLMIKGGMAGAMLAPEILMRDNEEAKKKFAIVNFIAAGVFSAVVFHNLTIPKVK